MKRAVLVVDDDAAVGSLVAAILRRARIEVGVVADGQAALERLAAGSWQLVLTDMTMPGLSGLDLLRAAEARGHRVPFLVMSAFLDPELERRLCEDPGVAGILRKPFDIARLVDDVKAVLDRPRSAGWPQAAGEDPARSGWELVRYEPAFAARQAAPRDVVPIPSRPDAVRPDLRWAGGAVVGPGLAAAAAGADEC